MKIYLAPCDAAANIAEVVDLLVPVAGAQAGVEQEVGLAGVLEGLET